MKQKQSANMPDFATMDREALNAFRKNAEKCNQKPTVENNHFTAKPRVQRCPQPSDWIPTCIATEWCEYHGPCKHKPENCNIIAAGSLAEFQKQQAQKKKVDLKTSLRMRKEVRFYPSRFFDHAANKVVD